MIVVGNLNILRANFKHEERLPFVIELLKALKRRGAYKTFRTVARPERLVGAVRDADLPAHEEKAKDETGTTEAVLADQAAQIALAELPVKTDEPKKEAVAIGARIETEVAADHDAILPAKVEELKREADGEDLTPGSSAASVVMTPATSTPDDTDTEEVQDWGELIKSVHAMGLQGSHGG